MPTPNPHTFPLMPYPGLAPERALRSGMGAWEPYGLSAPSDRLLPFVLSRRLLATNSRWVNCAWIINADSGVRVETLVPTGAPQAGGNVPTLGLVLSKQLDQANGADHFLYDGALVPDLSLPCGVPLRLIVDNAYQSPLFYAVAPAADLRLTHLQLDWYHDGPLAGVPYGRGFRQRLYVDNGALQFGEPRTEKVSSKNPDTGAEVLQSLSQYAVRAFAVAPVPTYLAEAVSVAQAPKFFLADEESWRLTVVKTTAVGEDGGRWALNGTLENQTPLLRRGCHQPALELHAYDPATDLPRGWRCGDTSDTASDFQPYGAFSCEVDTAQHNTGYVLESTQDLNRYSPTYGQAGPVVRSSAPDLVRCPLPIVYYSAPYTLRFAKQDCPLGQTGSEMDYTLPYGAATSSLSQYDADVRAQVLILTVGQDYVNQTGTCA